MRTMILSAMLVASLAVNSSTIASDQVGEGQKATPQNTRENPFRALNPDLFDRGERINGVARELRRVATSRQLPDSDMIAALQTALGGELAALTLRKNPTWSPDQKRYFLDQILDTVDPNVRAAAYREADLPAPPQNPEGNDLTGEQLSGLATRILNEATKNNTPDGTALTATSKAAGLIISNIVAERPNLSAEELVKITQNAVAEFAQEAIKYRASQKK
jgi:hypothetical protein